MQIFTIKKINLNALIVAMNAIIAENPFKERQTQKTH